MATQSRHSSRSASRSSIDRRALALLGLLAAGAAAGCGDDAQCGAADAPSDGVTVAAGSGEAETAAFGEFHSSPNNDCPPPGGGGAVSLTVQGAQVDPAGVTGFFILCLPRPDDIGGGAISLTDEDRVQLIDLVGETADGCGLDLDRDRPLEGTITFSGFCDDGTHADGYAMSFDATVPLLRTCAEGGDDEPIDAELGGSVAVIAD
jgi:hypothetical protein